MKYHIDDIIIYNDEDGTLSLQDSPEAENQTLTGTANAILRLLVAHHGTLIERETFLSEVWDERGLRGSNNSLNQYISILRRSLDMLVPGRAMIATVPRSGFMFSGDITVKTIAEAPLPTTEPAPTKKTNRGKGSWIGIAVTLLTVALCAILLKGHETLQTSSVHQIGQIGQCAVYTFSPIPQAFSRQAQAFAQQLSQDGKFSCMVDTVFYLHIQDTLFYGDPGRLVLSQCSHARGKARTCDTLYYYTWTP